MEVDLIIQKLTISVIPVLFAITVHEAAHGWVASKLGDKTAMMMGRLTLNPIKHIDPIGTILLPMLMLLSAGLMFGYAKPVPVSVVNFKHPRRDMALVALAGPLSNLLMAFGWILFAKIVSLITSLPPSASGFLIAMGYAGLTVNIVLMVLNLLPLPPLDGGRILSWMLPPKYSDYLDAIEPYGFIILVALIILGVLGKILFPMVYWFMTVLSAGVGL